jgi:hypothetical protein
LGSLNNFAHSQNSVAQLSGIRRDTSTIEEARCIFATNLTQSAALTAADATVRRRANIGRKNLTSLTQTVSPLMPFGSSLAISPALTHPA